MAQTCALFYPQISLNRYRLKQMRQEYFQPLQQSFGISSISLRHSVEKGLTSPSVVFSDVPPAVG